LSLSFRRLPLWALLASGQTERAVKAGGETHLHILPEKACDIISEDATGFFVPTDSDLDILVGESLNAASEGT